MSLVLTVMAQDAARESAWVSELRAALGAVDDTIVQGAKTGPGHGDWEVGQIIFVDSDLPGLHDALRTIDRKGRAVFLLVRDGGRVPDTMTEGLVDDVLVHPFRHVEILSRLSHYRQILMWDEVKKLNASFSEIIAGLREDLQLAEQLQKAKLPIRFTDIRGFQVKSRYLAGTRSGGDYFDLADAQDGNQLSVLLSDSSSYGLSSAVLSVLMKVAMRLTAEEVRSCYGTVRLIHNELLATLKETDKLSLFYGVISRKTLALKYLNLGTSCAFYSAAGKSFVELPSQGPALTRSGGMARNNPEQELPLGPEDRLAFISDGFVDAAGGRAKTIELLDRFREKSTVDFLNELVFLVKSKFAQPEDMPEQDCTAVMMDVDSKVIRLAR